MYFDKTLPMRLAQFHRRHVYTKEDPFQEETGPQFFDAVTNGPSALDLFLHVRVALHAIQDPGEPAQAWPCREEQNDENNQPGLI